MTHHDYQARAELYLGRGKQLVSLYRSRHYPLASKHQNAVSTANR